ncbi:MAG TPA: hypothetical protein VN673_11955 [Clostridia bacterium]|nr:hypothetical protein [Clostridia bacterium]
MNFSSLVGKFSRKTGILGGHKPDASGAPTMLDVLRFPYGPFRFKANLTKGNPYSVQASTDLRTWHVVADGTSGENFEYLDSDAAKFSHRFYRLLRGKIEATNVIGYASVTLPPGFSMIANPFESSSTISDFIRDWPDGTALSRFDTRLFRLTENTLQFGKWTNPSERLHPGEGAIFFNPTSDYKSLSFFGEVMQGNLSVPIPSGFSVRSSLVPQPGHLVDDLAFPIADGDVIHIFDREAQRYILYPYENGKWTSGAPVLGVAEAFWVAKTDPGNWRRHFSAVPEEPPAPPAGSHLA